MAAVSAPRSLLAGDPLAGVPLDAGDLQVLLNDVLERVTRVLRADTAAVLLVDASGSEVVARAARGIEEEVRQGVRVRLGTGFAGRVAAERRPVVVDDVGPHSVANPILWRKGVKTMLGVPLLADDQVVGVLHVGSLRPRRWEDRDIEILTLIADRLGAGIQLRLLDADRDAAEALQRSLLPSAPELISEFQCSARYVPAELGGIGGDWYDVFQLPDGELWVVVGDVTGHGLYAATVMGRVRSALRAYALLGRDPDEVLAMTDRKMAHFEDGSLATVALAVFRPPYDEALVSLAGHPPFVVARPGGEAELFDAAAGPPLGVFFDRPAPSTMPMPRGSVLVGFTDGLFERRREDIDVGLERVRGAVRAEPPAAVCERVMDHAIGEYVPEDDIALIAVRRR
jgi:sigma-B regulation protein RsbU (phosphoserine phosphatase)